MLASLKFMHMEIIWILVGIILDRLWDRGRDWYDSWRTNRHWAAVNQGYDEIDRLTDRFEIVQTGWDAGTFQEDHIKIELEGAYQIPEDVRTGILEPNRAVWTTKGFKDNVQCGVRQLQIVRTSDDIIRTELAHEIRIAAHTYQYFESMATHFEWFKGSSRDQLVRYAAGATHNSHARMMPTPLSVGLSLFCEGGKTLIFLRRTVSEGAGGHIAAGQFFNAVGENCTPADAFGELNEKTRLSVFRTASRGLLEEMGLDLRQVKVFLHTLCWDRKMLDYKFFGYVVCPLAVGEVRHYWHHAPDKSENREFVSQDVRDVEAVRELVRGMLRNREDWSDEARMCTIMSLLHMRRLSMSDLIALAGQQQHAADDAVRRG